eukprot:XP_003240802.2 PREDICTED: MD-2-related lipid-recognition protein-like [Acyrthosiphon pisum]
MAIFVITVVGLWLAASAVDAERVYNFRMCPNTQCRINELYIYPCHEAAQNKPCGWPENSNTSVAFVYTPEFGANSPRTQLYAETFLMDLPFLNIDNDACLYTSCPVEKDTQQYWLFDLYVPKNYGKYYYTVKYVLWNPIYHQQCCFVFDVQII